MSGKMNPQVTLGEAVQACTVRLLQDSKETGIVVSDAPHLM